MALTDKLADIADAIREVGGTTAKLTPAEMPAAIEKLGDGEYQTLVMYQGQTLTVACDLAKADGTAWEMPASDTLALHLWHGADTLDASGSTTTLCVDVPADAVTKLWHWTLVLSHGGTDYLVALGDAECRAEGKAKERRVAGVVDKCREVKSGQGGVSRWYARIDAARTKVTDYGNQNAVMRTARYATCASVGEYAFNACASLASVELPACTSVGGYAFYACASLASVELPACTSVGGGAFNACTSLASAELPACTSVGNYAFNSCTSLASVELPACTSVGGNAFNSCTSLSSVELPACTSVGGNAFVYASRIQEVVLPGETMCALTGGSCFYGTVTLSEGTLRIYVNDALVDDYKAATNWSTYAAYIRPISERPAKTPDAPDAPRGWDN